MYAKDFCIWLLGFIDLSCSGEKVEGREFTSEQLSLISRHLDMVMISEKNHNTTFYNACLYLKGLIYIRLNVIREPLVFAVVFELMEGLFTDTAGEEFNDARGFCYYFQGYFELSNENYTAENFTALDKNQKTALRRHLIRIIKPVKEVTTKQEAFCIWFGCMCGLEISLSLGTVREKLHDIFEHEIDPGFPVAEHGPLTQAHSGGRLNPTEHSEIIKC
jgi:hypothetical protein